MDPYEILRHFYPDDTPLRRVLLKHSEQVREKALEFLKNSSLDLDSDLVSAGALLHDTGILRCHAPSIFCTGSEPYIAHGIIGGAMLRAYGREHDLDLEPFARICERHTGAGLSASEIREQGLPLPAEDFLPETPEEKLICFADKFYSKSGSMEEKSLERARRSMEKFGPATLARFDEMTKLFYKPRGFDTAGRTPDGR
ncbi:MAG: HD domain-containing protein [Lentisphaeria bacterium]|nr:HD domain-containing protein [Lentisphaeria bacterium]